MAVDDPLRRLQDAIGYHFEDATLLLDAMTHASFLNERPDLARTDNERMEFLGDAILDLAASALLWRQYPKATEGELSRRRADLVCERGLAEIARGLTLGDAMRLGKGEIKSGGADKPRLLSSALEALIAGVYLDAGEREAITVARGLLAPFVETEEPGARDFKSRLQEHQQSLARSAPTYELVKTEGPDHDRVFHIQVQLEDGPGQAGSGRSKLRAEQKAARNTLEALDAASADESAAHESAADESLSETTTEAG